MSVLDFGDIVYVHASPSTQKNVLTRLIMMNLVMWDKLKWEIFTEWYMLLTLKQVPEDVVLMNFSAMKYLTTHHFLMFLYNTCYLSIKR